MTTPHAYVAEVPEHGLRFLGDEVRRDGAFPRAEVEQALEIYFATARLAADSGDWTPWADLFTEDAIYIEHAFGVIRGRNGILDWVTTMTGGAPTDVQMTPAWKVIENDRCLVYAVNWRPDPAGGDPYQFNAMAILLYAGNGQWCYEEDLYSPLEAKRVMTAQAAAKR